MGMFKYNTGGGGAQITICVRGGGHEKKVGNHCSRVSLIGCYGGC